MATALWLYWFTAGGVDEGRHWIEVALRLGGGQPYERATAMWLCGYLVILQGDITLAERYADDAAMTAGTADAGGAVEPAGSTGAGGLVAGASMIRGLAALFRGEMDSAWALSERAVRGFREEQDAFGVQQSLSQVGMAEMMRGHLDEARAALDQAYAYAVQGGELWHRSYVVWALGMLHAEEGRPDQALAEFRRSLRLKNTFRDARGIGALLETTAWVIADQRDPLTAAQLLGGAQAVWPATGLRLFGFRALIETSEQYRNDIRTELGERDFAEAFARGLAMTVRDAVALALGEGPR
ncbi:hypothetical protein AB0I10_03325 [Streptomyces sp. NPDC050636]|uniref:hypothetical protein n=1 Tax=Streptomyces sp. NPDC050636 TaxID=3154510 RepID=UPI003429C0E5